MKIIGWIDGSRKSEKRTRVIAYYVRERWKSLGYTEVRNRAKERK